MSLGATIIELVTHEDGFSNALRTGRNISMMMMAYTWQPMRNPKNCPPISHANGRLRVTMPSHWTRTRKNTRWKTMEGNAIQNYAKVAG
jgi:hypothetical protein